MKGVTDSERKDYSIKAESPSLSRVERKVQTVLLPRGNASLSPMVEAAPTRRFSSRRERERGERGVPGNP